MRFILIVQLIKLIVGLLTKALPPPNFDSEQEVEHWLRGMAEPKAALIVWLVRNRPDMPFVVTRVEFDAAMRSIRLHGAKQYDSRWIDIILRIIIAILRELGWLRIEEE